MGLVGRGWLAGYIEFRPQAKKESAQRATRANSAYPASQVLIESDATLGGWDVWDPYEWRSTIPKCFEINGLYRNSVRMLTFMNWENYILISWFITQLCAPSRSCIPHFCFVVVVIASRSAHAAYSLPHSVPAAASQVGAGCQRSTANCHFPLRRTENQVTISGRIPSIEFRIKTVSSACFKVQNAVR